LYSKNSAVKIACMVEFSKIIEDSLFFESISGTLPKLKDLNDHRNDWSHQPLPSEMEVADTLGEVLPEFAAVIGQLNFLRESSLWRFGKTGKGDTHTVYTFRGEGRPRRDSTHKVSDATVLSILKSGAPEQRLFLEVGGKSIPLWPFLTFERVGGGDPQLASYYFWEQGDHVVYLPCESTTPIEKSDRHVGEEIERTINLIKRK
jgi:hypothetical protein